MSGDDIWKVLEGIVSGVNQFNGEEVTSFLQVSQGIRIEYNPMNNNRSRLIAANIGNSSLDRAETYNIVTLDFLAGGGDNFFGGLTFENPVTPETQDEIFVWYIESQTPVDIALDGRIAIVNGTAPTNGAPGNSGTVEENSSSNVTESTGGASGLRSAHGSATTVSAGLLVCIMVIL